MKTASNLSAISGRGAAMTSGSGSLFVCSNMIVIVLDLVEQDLS